MAGPYLQLNMAFESGDFFAVDRQGNSLVPGDIVLINNKLFKIKDAEYYYDHGREQVLLVCENGYGAIFHFPTEWAATI